MAAFRASVWIARTDTRVIAYDLDRLLGGDVTASVFPAPWPRKVGRCTVGPDLSFAVFSGVHAVQAFGGVLELDERMEHGVVREVLEETNVIVRPVHLTGVYKNMNLGVVALVMRAEIVSGEPNPTTESSEADWWTRDRVIADMTEAFAIRILDALDHHGSAEIRHHDGVNLLD